MLVIAAASVRFDTLVQACDTPMHFGFIADGTKIYGLPANVAASVCVCSDRTMAQSVAG